MGAAASPSPTNPVFTLWIGARAHLYITDFKARREHHCRFSRTSYVSYKATWLGSLITIKQWLFSLDLERFPPQKKVKHAGKAAVPTSPYTEFTEWSVVQAGTGCRCRSFLSFLYLNKKHWLMLFYGTDLFLLSFLRCQNTTKIKHRLTDSDNSLWGTYFEAIKSPLKLAAVVAWVCPKAWHLRG